jgi:uncharacterized membrane protein
MKKYFFTGLVTLLPLAVTIWVVHFFVNLLTKPFLGLFTAFSHHLPEKMQTVVQALSQLIILLIIFFFVLFMGFVARRFFFSSLIRLGDRIMIRIPLVNKLYHTSKEIIKALFGSKTKSFQQVVILPFPNPNSYCLGLVAKEAPQTCSEAEGEELVSVFVPTTPNPTAGFLVMCNRKHLVNLDMKADAAIKYVVSCAVIQPESVK